jgi:hypothetical protein
VYAVGGNEQSARLMGLPVNRTKVLVYTLNGFCSALAGITMSIYVLSGHGLYADTFEMDVIASVVMGGTMLTGGVGHVFGTLFGVLITGITQTVIQFNGQLSSWWTRIVVGALTLLFISVQSLLAARESQRQSARRKMLSRARQAGEPAEAGALAGWRLIHTFSRQVLLFGGLAIVVIVTAVVSIGGAQRSGGGLAGTAPQPTADGCEMKPFRQDQAEALMQGGAIITYERNGGPNCIDELYGIYPDGRILADDGSRQIEGQLNAAELDELLTGIADRGWFTAEFYDTWHTPCGQCFGHYVTVYYQGEAKTVKGVDGGTDAPAKYWLVVNSIKRVVPEFEAAS